MYIESEGGYMELALAAHKLVRELLEVKEGENVVILGDTTSDRYVIEATAAAVYTAGAIPTVIYYPKSQEVMMPPPKPVHEALKAADVVVSYLTKPVAYTKSMYESIKAGAIWFPFPTFDADALIRMVGKVNYPKMEELGKKLIELAIKAKTLRVTDPGGTDLSSEIPFDRPLLSDTGTRKDAEVTHGVVWPAGGMAGWLPHLETINGTIVFDGLLWPVVDDAPLRNPVEIKVKEGRVVDFKGRDEARKFEKWLSDFKNPNMYNIAHITFGFHPTAKLTGHSAERERIFGGFVVGIGHVSPEVMGEGETLWEAPAHADGVVLHPSILLDNELIEKDGMFVHPELAKICRILGV